jgi:Pentapeptide repeats (8 copies)
MRLTPEQRRVFREILSPNNGALDIVALARRVGLEPRRYFAGGDWRGVNFGSNDLSGFDFTGADLRDADISQATGIDRIITDAATRLPVDARKLSPHFDSALALRPKASRSPSAPNFS